MGHAVMLEALVSIKKKEKKKLLMKKLTFYYNFETLILQF
jgi:hypothetical protein